MTPRTPGSVLIAAQQSNLSHDERLATITLRSLQRGVPDLPVESILTRADVILTILGASSLELDLEDQQWRIEASGILDPDANGLLNAVAVAVDQVPFRLADARRDPGGAVLTLEFEDLAMALLDEHNKKKSASRGSRTRAQFIESLVTEIKARDLVFWSPEKDQRQGVARPDFPQTRPATGDTGFGQGAKFKIKGVTADVGQMSEVATALGVADQEAATPRARMAMLVAGIGESEFRAIPNRTGSGYAGVFQADPTNIPAKDTAQQARYFLTGGKGFQQGGAIKLARANPGMSVGEIAYRVEGSRSNFASDAAAEQFYGTYHDEAKAILELWTSGTTGTATDQVLRFKQYRFTRGLPGKKETSREAATRLAEEVNWRFYAIGGVVAFCSDDELIRQPPELVLDAKDGIPDGLLKMPGYQWMHGKLPAQVELEVIANAWGVFPGEVVQLNNMGPVTGRWIVETFRFNLLDATSARITLIKPITKRKEPAPEAVTVDLSTTNLPAGAGQAIAWAKSRIGHYSEEFGNNRGAELDALEARFGLQGAPWCAIFATTALIHGGVSRDVRTALVADLARWCKEGSHGLQKGFRGTPRPGDLMVFNVDTPQTGDDHVALVEKVSSDGRTVDIIEGNTSARQVSTRGILADQGQFIRPSYPT